MWNWLTSSFANQIFAQTWYNGAPVKFKKFSSDKTSFVIGNVSLRQVRVQSGK
jgi:hypothetical protein